MITRVHLLCRRGPSARTLCQPPCNRACGFDIFVWIPAFPLPGIHVSQQASAFSFSARRLAEVGAESALAASGIGCDNDVGVLAGSSAMDGFRGQIQRMTSCTRYGFTKPELIKPVVTTVVPTEQCGAMSCNAYAPARSDVVSRSFNMFASSGLENAYTESLHMLTTTQRGQGLSLRHPSMLHSDYVAFETVLARESRGNDCCSGYTCVLVVSGLQNTTGSCMLQADVPLPLPPPPMTPPSLPPPLTSPSPASPSMVEEVMFGIVVAYEAMASFVQADYKLHVSLAAGVPVSCITLQVDPSSGNVTTIIRPEYNSAVTAQDVKTNLTNAWNGDETAASSVLGVSVDKIFAPPDVYLNRYPPSRPPAIPPDMLSPPPLAPVSSSDKNDVGLIVGLVLGGAALLAAVAGGATWFYVMQKRKKDDTKDPKDARKSLLERGKQPNEGTVPAKNQFSTKAGPQDHLADIFKIAFDRAEPQMQMRGQSTRRR